KALMPGDAIPCSGLDSGNDRRAESLRTSRITGTRGSLRAICQRRLDRLDQDICSVIRGTTVDIEGIAWKGRCVLLTEGRRNLILTNCRIYHRSRTKGRTTAQRLNATGK